MTAFTFTYQGRLLNAAADHYTEGGYNRYRITLVDQTFVIAPSGFTGKDGKTIWVQPVKPGEFDQPHDLVQALGEGIEKETLLKP